MTTTMYIFTDGSGNDQGGAGGWGAILRLGTHERELSGAELFGSNNQMEMWAVAQALLAIKWRGQQVEIVTDSKNTIGWISGWNTVTDCYDPTKPHKRNNPIIRAIAEHIEQIIADKLLTVGFTHVKGHSGHPENERCDVLAREARMTLHSAPIPGWPDWRIVSSEAVGYTDTCWSAVKRDGTQVTHAYTCLEPIPRAIARGDVLPFTTTWQRLAADMLYR